MTQLFLNPLTKFTSDNITALPGARLYFYQNNSSTPKAVYADKNKVTSLGVYVEADSSGIFEPIWLDGVYRATLKYSSNWASDPVGVVQTGWPIDDIGDIGNFAAFSAWDSTFTYDITTNTLVSGSNGRYYQSIQNPNLNKNPISNADYWKEVRFIGVWNPNISYVEFDIVEWEGKLYGAKNIVNVNHEPPNGTYWNDLTFNNNIVGDLDVSGNINSLSITLDNSASSDPLKLDWYQEGTFTPVVIGTGAAGAGTYITQVGRYTRIGNVVYISITIAWSAHTGTADMQISGLPFTAGPNGLGTFSFDSSTLSIGAGKLLTLKVNGFSSIIVPALIDQATGTSSGLPIDTSVTYLSVSGFYFA